MLEKRPNIGAVLLGFCAVGLHACGSEREMDTRVSDFAAYWGDSQEWCAYLADCGIQERRPCEESWATASETEAAVKAAGVDVTDLERCERAARSLDDCSLRLSCDEYQASTACAANHSAGKGRSGSPGLLSSTSPETSQTKGIYLVSPATFPAAAPLSAAMGIGNPTQPAAAPGS